MFRCWRSGRTGNTSGTSFGAMHGDRIGGRDEPESVAGTAGSRIRYCPKRSQTWRNGSDLAFPSETTSLSLSSWN